MYQIYYINNEGFSYSKVLDFKPNETLTKSIKKCEENLSINVFKIN